MKVFDVFLFGYELDLLEIRMNLLDPYVDYFVFSEGSKTFSGEDKGYIFKKTDKRFKKFKDKIIYTKIEEPSQEELQAKGIQYNVKRESFMRDTYYKDSIMDVLKEHCSDEDIIIWSDLDEVPNPEVIEQYESFYKPGTVYNFAQDNYQAALNWFETSGTIHSQTKDFSYEEEGPRWIGTKMCDFATLKKYTLTSMRRELPQENNLRIYPGGWHWSTVGSDEETTMYDRVMKKIKSSAHTELNNDRLIGELEQRLKDGRSPLGQDNASYCICHFDEDRFPQYLLDNQEKYSYLIK
jgi:beta-1,4-mannosyl-glycoprotein beta-1,4-N-acetylglucosaminyltransferase